MNAQSLPNMHKAGIVILAAGNSSRLGGDIKQLLPWRNQTLLQHIITEAELAGLSPIVVVTGAYTEQVSASVTHLKISMVYNPVWAEGKASGIVAGVQHILSQQPDLEKIILSVCDQPFVSAALFSQLLHTQQDSQKQIVASAYANTLGTPVLFTRRHFAQLQSLQHDEGAKKLLNLHPADLAVVDFPEGSLDIDTQEDYAKLL